MNIRLSRAGGRDFFIVFSIYFRTEPRTSLAERCLVNLGERR
jgi:hypothetical protein